MSASAFKVRLGALVRKETRQMLRDRSNLLVGLMLPVILILLFGYGLSFDVKNAPVALVMDNNSAAAREVVSGIGGSRYLVPVRTGSMAQAEDLLRAGRVDAIVRIPVDFAEQQAHGQAQVQLVLNGIDSTTANTLEAYISGAIGTVTLHRIDRGSGSTSSAGSVALMQRIWFNEAGISTWYLVPGLVALIMTLVGAFLTSLLIAREWERGTLEALFVTPVQPLELVLAKIAPYLVIGLIDLIMCVVAARLLFEVPIRGSLLAILMTSMAYLMVSLLMGLFISGATRNQFAASQMALLTSFMPAMMLSGFVFDLRNVPLAVKIASQIVPATHFMGVIKTLFLAGTDWAMVFRSCAIMLGYSLVLLALTWRTVRKRLD